MTLPVLRVSDLSVVYPTKNGAVNAIQSLSLELKSGKTLTLLGESGCGKSTLGRALLGLLPPPGEVTSGSISLLLKGDQDLTGMIESDWQKVRGKQISMIFQDPVQALNPIIKVGKQITEAILAHRQASRSKAKAFALQMLNLLEFTNANRVFTSYPFQLSGGMCQRVAIATALINNARILIADEPTTALDVRVQSVILRLIKNLQRELGISLLLITHDVAVTAEIADEIAVMYAGRLVETGSADQILQTPVHPYTQALLSCAPDVKGKVINAMVGQPPDLVEPPDRCLFLPRCRFASEHCWQSPFPPMLRIDQNKRVQHQFACYHPIPIQQIDHYQSQKSSNVISVNSFEKGLIDEDVSESDLLLKVNRLCKHFTRNRLFQRERQRVTALNQVSLSVQPGEILGLVGESGCGKSTLARCILGLEKPDSGEIYVTGIPFQHLKGEKQRKLRRFMQPVFQSPRGSLNTGRTASELVQEPLRYFQVGSPKERQERAQWLLDMVGIDKFLMSRKPNHLSTGQCQRIAIARALVLEPKLLICDEPVSSLDLSVQAQILSLLAKLHTSLKFGMLFISHNILVVRSIATRTLVMQAGEICETLPSSQSDYEACHPYTKSLFQSIPQHHLGTRN